MTARDCRPALSVVRLSVCPSQQTQLEWTGRKRKRALISPSTWSSTSALNLTITLTSVSQVCFVPLHCSDSFNVMKSSWWLRCVCFSRISHRTPWSRELPAGPQTPEGEGGCWSGLHHHTAVFQGGHFPQVPGRLQRDWHHVSHSARHFPYSGNASLLPQSQVYFITLLF